MHSTPQFPYRRNKYTFWPPSGNNNAQTFICVTLHYNQFAYVGKVPTQRSIKETQSGARVLKLSMLILCCPQVNIYSTSRLTHLTMIFPPTSTETWGKLLTTGRSYSRPTASPSPSEAPLEFVSLQKTRPMTHWVRFRSAGHMFFLYFPFRKYRLMKLHQTLKISIRCVVVAPHPIRRLNAPALSLLPQQLFHCAVSDGDLYVDIGQHFRSDVFAQTWGGQPRRDQSFCKNNVAKVYNVKDILTNAGAWKPSCDHSKWCVLDNQNNNWVCIADMNRSGSQYWRRGGALCLEDQIAKTAFRSAVVSYERCGAPVNTDTCGGRSW